MCSRPEYVSIWLGIAMAGGVTALLNINLNGPSLAHCLAISGAAHLIVESELLDSVERLPGTSLKNLAVWCHGPSGGRYPPIDQPIDLPAPQTAINISDTALLIYTSGTTGL